MRQNVKLLLHAYQRKKKTFALGLKKKEQFCLFWKRKENVADSPFAPKTRLFVCFQNKPGKPGKHIHLPRTVNKHFFFEREKNIHPTQMPKGYFNSGIPLTTQQHTDEAMLRITSKQKKSYFNKRCEFICFRAAHKRLQQAC